MAILERIKNHRGEEVSIQNYVDPKTICFLDVQSPKEAIMELVSLLEKEGKIADSNTFFDAVMDREKIVSTAIGLGVAVPHAKLPEYDDFFIAIGILKDPGIEWKAIDGTNVRIIFLIGGPDYKQTEYLQILSKITFVIKDDEKRKQILSANDPIAVARVFEGC